MNLLLLCKTLSHKDSPAPPSFLSHFGHLHLSSPFSGSPLSQLAWTYQYSPVEDPPCPQGGMSWDSPIDHYNRLTLIRAIRICSYNLYHCVSLFIVSKKTLCKHSTRLQPVSFSQLLPIPILALRLCFHFSRARYYQPSITALLHSSALEILCPWFIA